MRHVVVAERLCQAGRFGVKAGRGYYAYPEAGGAGLPDPEVAAIVAEERARKGIVPRRVGAAEIVRRVLAAMANEGARVVEQGVALRGCDVDLVMLHGYGFPRHLGGPLHWADETGHLALRADLRAWEAEEPGAWTPAGLWDEVIKTGGRLGQIGA